MKKEVKSNFPFSSSSERNIQESSPPEKFKYKAEETKSTANECANKYSNDKDSEIIKIGDIDNNQLSKSEDDLTSAKKAGKRPKRRVVSYNLVELANKYQGNEFE